MRDALAGWGHDATTVHEEKLAGRPDADVAAAVKAEERCLVTFDTYRRVDWLTRMARSRNR